jgi:hypothetical protein
VSAQPAWDDSGLPVIATASNIDTIGLSTVLVRLIKFTASDRAGRILFSPSLFWVVVINTTSNNAARATLQCPTYNCVLKCSGTAFDYIGNAANRGFHNVRIEGNPSASSGSRVGFTFSNVCHHSFITAVGCPGAGISSALTTAGWVSELSRFVSANNGAGVLIASTASQTSTHHITGGVVVNNAGYGIDGGAGNNAVDGCRLRDNTSGNFTNMGNWPTTFDNLTSAGTDANEFVNVATGDYRIKATSALWGKGYGAGDEIPTPAAIAAAVWVRVGRSTTP